MDKMVVIVFDDEETAYQARNELQELHSEGSIALYAAAVVAKDADGQVSVKEAADEGPLGTAVGMLTGSMVGLMAVAGGAAPVAAAIGMTGGALFGSIADLTDVGIDSQFLQEVNAALEPGKVAVVAEGAENWVTPLDSRMEALGGTVYRTSRTDFVDDLIDQDIAQTQADFARMKEEYKEANDETKAKLKAKMDATQAKLDALGERAKARSQANKAQMKAKVESLEAQAKKANKSTKKKFRKHADNLKESYEESKKKLKKSWKKVAA